jgi:hypothetical protein
MWPTGGDTTYVVANTTVGKNSIADLPFSMEVQWYGSGPLEWNTTSLRYGYSERISILPEVSNPLFFNYWIAEMKDSVFSLPDGRHYTNSVDVLGLGPHVVNSPDTGNSIGGESTFFEQLKASEKIVSSSFSMHMGVFNTTSLDPSYWAVMNRIGRWETSAFSISTTGAFHICSYLM